MLHTCSLGGEGVQRALYSPRETEAILGVSHATLYRLINAGRLDARKIDNKTVITDEFDPPLHRSASESGRGGLRWSAEIPPRWRWHPTLRATDGGCCRRHTQNEYAARRDPGRRISQAPSTPKFIPLTVQKYKHVLLPSDCSAGELCDEQRDRTRPY